MRRTLYFGCLAIVFALFPASKALAGCSYDLNGVGYGDNCPYQGGGGYQAPAGPSAEVLKQQAEQKDMDEAAQDADDKGVAAYKRGDWNAAMTYFKEAHDEAPDDTGILSNLQHAQQKVADERNVQANEEARKARMNEEARKLKSIEQHSLNAARSSGAPASAEAGKGFDTAGKPAGSLDSSVVYEGSEGSKDPVVPDSKRTQAITDLEKQRTDSRGEIKVLDEKLQKLDPAKSVVEIGKIKQDKTNIESKVNMMDFTIGDMLDHPEKFKPSNKTATP